MQVGTAISNLLVFLTYKKMTTLYYKYQFSIGFNDKDSKIQELPDDEIREKIEDITLKILEFGTLSNINKWVYKHEDGTKIVEKSLNVERLTDDDFININAKVNAFIKAIKKALNQETVLVSYTRERANFQ